MARPEGSPTTKRKRVDMRELAWTAIWQHKRFTTFNIRAATGISENNLRMYLQALERAGYIRIERQRQSGKSMGHAVWRLCRWTGVQHPLPRRDGSGVWDQNQQKLYPYREENKDGQKESAA